MIYFIPTATANSELLTVGSHMFICTIKSADTELYVFVTGALADSECFKEVSDAMFDTVI